MNTTAFVYKLIEEKFIHTWHQTDDFGLFETVAGAKNFIEDNFNEETVWMMQCCGEREIWVGFWDVVTPTKFYIKRIEVKR